MDVPHGPQCRFRRSPPDDAVLLCPPLDPAGAAVVAGRAFGALDVDHLDLRADRTSDHEAASFRSFRSVEAKVGWAAGPRVGRYSRTASSILAPSVYSVTSLAGRSRSPRAARKPRLRDPVRMPDRRYCLGLEDRRTHRVRRRTSRIRRPAPDRSRALDGSAGGATPGPTSCASIAHSGARREPQHRACGTQPVSPESAHREIDRDEDHRQDQADPKHVAGVSTRSDPMDKTTGLPCSAWAEASDVTGGRSRSVRASPSIQDHQDQHGDPQDHKRKVAFRSPGGRRWVS
jgi:hypothetical protein